MNGLSKCAAIRAKRFSPIAALLCLAACVPDLGPKPQLQAPQTLSAEKTLAGKDGQWPTDKWWQVYGDATLNQLEDEALQGSPDLKIAEARFREAAAVSQEAGAALLPDLSLDASAQSTKESLNQGFPKNFQTFLPHGWHTQTRVAGSLNYELDLYGKNRAALAAATSDERAAAVDLDETRLVLSTSVAGEYAELVRLSADKQAAQDAVHVRQQSADQFAQREREGLENRGAAAQAQAEADAARADEDIIDGQIGIVRDELAALVGKGPDRGLEVPLPAARDIQPLAPPPRLAADLIGRRPDLVAARLRAEAASERIKVAHADFYPNIDLNGLIGFQSLDISQVFMHASLIGAIGPALHLPIFDGGRIEGAYRGARASYDEAVATYDRTLVNSLHDVADAMVGERELQAELDHSRAALKQSEDAYRIANLRYRGGLSRYLDVLTAEDTLVAQRKRVADLEASAFAQNVVLIRALGGGFRTSA
jgi:NodT family efflux transporter outer membrane factor (OMF) lipoprotein